MSAQAERYARLHAIFREARPLDHSARAGLLDERCGPDATLRSEVEELLAAFDDDGASDVFSETGIGRARGALERLVPGSKRESTWLPERVGRYRVLRRIGEGGMGVVYEAEQDSPKRRVAIKLLHPLQATPERLKRFRHEAELLGRLQHPGIAQIHEAGTYDLGRGEQPFFAMELVDGVNIRTFAERARLDVRARLTLLAEVADAMHHAHGRGVIHRDLKPDNVLVDERGQPKVLDFGVARAAESSDIVSTLVTQEGVLMGTLAYMAPEQLAGDSAAITPQTDVYALGVLAFELLSGRLPHEIGGLQLPAAMKVLGDEPTQSLGVLVPSLRDDVETIVTKALEKEPARRYASAEALATDIRRHLDHLPIAARPPSRAYLVKKYVRRNRSLVTVLGIALLAAVVSGLFGLRANRARTVTERKVAQSTLMNASLMMELSGPTQALLESVPPEFRGWEWRHLSSRQEPPLAKLESARAGFELLPDGRAVMLASHEGVVSWIDVDSGELRKQERLDLGTIQSVRSSPSGRELLVVGHGRSRWESGWLGRWSLQRHELVSRHEVDCYAMSIDPVTERVLASDLESVFWIDMRTGARLATRELPNVRSSSIGGDRVAVAQEEGGQTWILDAETLETLYNLPDASGPRLSPNGRWLKTSHLRSLDLWDLRTASPSKRRLMTGPGGIQGEFTPDGNVLVIVSGEFSTWDVRTGQLLDRFANQHGAPLGGLAFSADSRRGLSIDRSGEVRAWDVTSPFLLRGHTGYVYPVALDVERGLLVSGGWDGHYGPGEGLRLWDVATGEPVASLGEEGQIVMALALSGTEASAYVALRSPTRSSLSPGQRVVSAIVRLDLSTGRIDELFRRDSIVDQLLHLSQGERLVWSEDGSNGGRRVVVADVVRDEILLERPVPELTRGPALAASPDGKWIAVGPLGEVHLWHSGDFEPARSWSSGGGRPNSLAFSADSRRLVGTVGNTVRVWSVPDGAELAVLEDHARMTHCAVFSPDGTRIASGGADGAVRIWDAETYGSICLLSGHDAYVYSLAWSPDGELLVSGSGDKTVRLWNAESASERADARRERARILERVEPQVLRLLEERNDADRIQAHVETHPDWTPRERQVALQVLLREGIEGGRAR